MVCSWWLQLVVSPAADIHKDQCSRGLMAWGLLTSDGLSQTVICNRRLKVNSQAFQDLILNNHIPWLKQNYPDGRPKVGSGFKIVFQLIDRHQCSLFLKTSLGSLEWSWLTRMSGKGTRQTWMLCGVASSWMSKDREAELASWMNW